ncbi:MAG: hypothetical protein WAW82_03145 [Candidatus Lutibacillus vidarii]|nr:hypothetical protein [Candidatus Lutibacillus vidarii]
MRATIMLCDYATVADGKLYISGGGWSVTNAQVPASAVAAKFEVPWTQANQPIRIAFRLIDADGAPVLLAGPQGPLPVGAEAVLEVSRPLGVPAGTPIDAPMAFGVPPLSLAAGRRFGWVLEVDGETREDWTLTFSTRPAGEHP